MKAGLPQAAFRSVLSCFAIQRAGSRPSALDFLCLPSLPPTQVWGFHAAAVFRWLAGVGSGYRVLAFSQAHSRVLARAFNGYLNFTKPNIVRHRARGNSWRHKCPLWMSSTQWGRVTTVWAEELVAGGRAADMAAVGSVLLWALLLPLIRVKPFTNCYSACLHGVRHCFSVPGCSHPPRSRVSDWSRR